MTDNHTGIDTSAEAVERLAKEVSYWWEPESSPFEHCVVEVVSTLRALSVELTAAREALAQIGGLSDEGYRSGTAADRWFERIDDVCIAGKPLPEYAEYAWPTAHDDSGGV